LIHFSYLGYHRPLTAKTKNSNVECEETNILKNGLAKMNLIFLVKTKCHKPLAGTYSKAIMMIYLHSKMSSERVKNHLFSNLETA